MINIALLPYLPTKLRENMNKEKAGNNKKPNQLHLEAETKHTKQQDLLFFSEYSSWNIFAFPPPPVWVVGFLFIDA